MTANEVAAARRWWSADRLGDAASQCIDRSRAALAADWATADCGAFADAEFTGYLAVRSGGRRWAYPASLTLARLNEMLERLYREACDESCDSRLADAGLDRLNRLLHASSTIPLLTKPATVTDPQPQLPMASGTESDDACTAESPVGPVSEVGPAYPGIDLMPAGEQEWLTGEPHTVLRLGNRVFSFLVVPTYSNSTAMDLLKRAHESIADLSPSDLFTGMGLNPIPGAVHIPVLLTHGLADFRAFHGQGYAVLDLMTFRQILRDADEHRDGRDLVWQFLEDLAEPLVEVARILPAAPDDLWAHWLQHGGFLPFHSPAHPEPIDVLIGPTLWDPTWERTAALDGVADLVERAGLPDIALLSSLHDDGNSQATAWDADAGFALSVAAPHIVVGGPTNDPDLPAQTEPAAVLGLVVGIRNALANSGLGAALANAEGIYRLHVQLVSEVSPDDPRELRLAGSDLNGYELLVPVNALRLFLLEPQAIHDSIGYGLASPHLDNPDVAQALVRWQSLPPLVDLDATPRIADEPPAHQWTEPTIASTNRAQRAYRARILDADLPPDGSLNGRPAVDWVRRVALPAAFAALNDQIHRYDPSEMLVAAARAVDAAHAERARRQRVMQLGLHSAHADSIRHMSLAQPDTAQLTRPAEILLDHVLRRSSAQGGAERPDRLDIAEMTSLAMIALELAIGADLAARGLGGLTLAVRSRSFITAVSPNRTGIHLDDDDMTAGAQDLQESGLSQTGNPPVGHTEAPDISVSVTRWLRAARARNLADTPLPVLHDPTEPISDSGWKPIMSDPEVPGKLHALDDAMRRELGWGLDAIFATLSVVASHEPSFVPVTTIGRLAQTVTDWAGVPDNEARAAVEFLVHRPREDETDYSFYEQERRPQRTFLRPLTPLDAERILLPRHLTRALQEVAADMLGEGRLVWPYLPTAVTNAAVEFRKWTTEAFEGVVEAIVNGFGLPFRPGLEPHKAEAAGVSGLAGEIDILACDQANGRLWLLEAKEHIESASPYSITMRVRRFLKSGKGYVNKTLAKVEVVRAHADAFAAIACNRSVSPPAGGWTVLPVMVTRRVEPAAFPQGRDSAIPFVLAGDLARHLETLDQNYDQSS